jgi:hypothetical protein
MTMMTNAPTAIVIPIRINIWLLPGFGEGWGRAAREPGNAAAVLRKADVESIHPGWGIRRQKADECLEKLGTCV